MRPSVLHLLLAAWNVKIKFPAFLVTSITTQHQKKAIFDHEQTIKSKIDIVAPCKAGLWFKAWVLKMEFTDLLEVSAQGSGDPYF